MQGVDTCFALIVGSKVVKGILKNVVPETFVGIDATHLKFWSKNSSRPNTPLLQATANFKVLPSASTTI